MGTVEVKKKNGSTTIIKTGRGGGIVKNVGGKGVTPPPGKPETPPFQSATERSPAPADLSTRTAFMVPVDKDSFARDVLDALTDESSSELLMLTAVETQQKESLVAKAYSECPLQFPEVQKALERRGKAISALFAVHQIAGKDPDLVWETVRHGIMENPDTEYATTFHNLVRGGGRFPTTPTPKGYQTPKDSKGNPPKAIYAQYRPYGAPKLVFRGGATRNPVVKAVLKAHGFRWDTPTKGWFAYRYDVDEIADVLESLGVNVVEKV